MGKLTIKKEAANRFLVAGDGIGKIRGIEKYWNEDNDIHFLKPNGEPFKKDYSEIEVYDLEATEASEFNSLDEFLTILETIGFANFKLAGATALPYYVGVLSQSGILPPNELNKKSTMGAIEWMYNTDGSYSGITDVELEEDKVVGFATSGGDDDSSIKNFLIQYITNNEFRLVCVEGVDNHVKIRVFIQLLP